MVFNAHLYVIVRIYAWQEFNQPNLAKSRLKDVSH